MPPLRLRRSGERGRRGREGPRVSVTDSRGRPVQDHGLARWLAGVAPARVRGHIAIALVSDRYIRTLNQQYRRKNTPTDVLSFPAETSVEPASASGEPRVLGDIVIATGVAQRQARRMGHSYETELRVLALHGLLHLLGYDHERSEDRGRMARAEARLRQRGGLHEGLIARGTRASGGGHRIPAAGDARRGSPLRGKRVEGRLPPQGRSHMMNGGSGSSSTGKRVEARRPPEGGSHLLNVGHPRSEVRRKTRA